MDSIWINAPAKINIGLDVIRRREDGYHEVKMIMQSIRLFDRLTLTKTKEPGIKLTTNLSYLPVNEDNLVYQSAKRLMDEFHLEGGLDIKLDKRIPVAAGMAGGSTDAASCMLAINDLYGLGLSKRHLMKRGVKLGADIPYCILKGTALSEGIGEKLSTIPAMPSCYILIAKPNIHVSTKWVYTNLVLDEHTNHPDIDGMLASMKKRDLLSLSNQIGNVLESVTIPAYPQIAAIKECMLQNGAVKVYAVDVGYGQLAWSLRTDERVVNMERTNIRNVTLDQLAEPIEFFSVDVSFISLHHIFPVAQAITTPDAMGVCLVKPQFEAGREKVGKNGVVRDPATHREVLHNAMGYAAANGFKVCGLDFSPVKGPEGNIEYLMFVQKSDEPGALDDSVAEQVVASSHSTLDR